MKKLTRFMWQQVSLVCCNFSLILYKINGILFSCDLHAGLAAAHIWSLDREAGLGCDGQRAGGRIRQDWIAWG